jgi:hypothetical protein
VDCEPHQVTHGPAAGDVVVGVWQVAGRAREEEDSGWRIPSGCLSVF